MSVEMKVWTCKYPEDSNLNKRLREASKQANLPYYKLLANMLDLWDKYQVENSLQSDNLNARINKIEKFMERVNEEACWKWDSESEKWITPDEQHNKTDKQPEAEPSRIENVSKAKPTNKTSKLKK